MLWIRAGSLRSFVVLMATTFCVAISSPILTDPKAPESIEYKWQKISKISKFQLMIWNKRHKPSAISIFRLYLAEKSSKGKYSQSSSLLKNGPALFLFLKPVGGGGTGKLRSLISRSEVVD